MYKGVYSKIATKGTKSSAHCRLVSIENYANSACLDLHFNNYEAVGATCIHGPKKVKQQVETIKTKRVVTQ